MTEESRSEPERVDTQTGELLPAEASVTVRRDALQEFGDDIGLDRARKIANQLDGIIQEKGLSVRIGQSQHLRVEAWLACAAMVGLSPRTEWVKEIRDPSTGRLDGFTARVQVIRLATGAVVGAAEASCWSNELQRKRDGTFLHRWSDWCPRYDVVPTDPCASPITLHAVSSMSQTRATSKAIGQCLRWVVVLAGYSGTPAEEITEAMRERDREERQPQRKSPPQDERKVTEGQVKRLWAITYSKIDKLGIEKAQAGAKMRQALAAMGFDSVKDLTRAPYEQLCDMVDAWTSEHFEATQEELPREDENGK